MQIRKNPFKLNRVETDPNGYGLRANEIIESLDALVNNQSILISGTRGIGKSSLGYQLQQILEGDQTLLKRLGIAHTFQKYMTMFYACDKEITLAQLIHDILFEVEQNVARLKLNKPEKVKSSFSVDFILVKASIEREFSKSHASPSTLATILVDGLYTAFTHLSTYTSYKGINIFIDEIDQIPPAINFAHFIKIVHEMLTNKGLSEISFMFAGQTGIFLKLYEQDESFQRIVRHVPLDILDVDACSYILTYAATQASPPFIYDDPAQLMIISIASGFPYDLHLIGYHSYSLMGVNEKMFSKDVMNGIAAFLKSDKRELYLGRFAGLDPEERRILLILSEYLPDAIPALIPISWIYDKIRDYSVDEFALHKSYIAIKALLKNGHLIHKRDIDSFMFKEELFRIFLALIRMEQTEIERRKAHRNSLKESPQRENSPEYLGLVALLKLDQFESDFSEDVLKRVLTNLSSSEYETSWEDIDLIDLEDYDFTEDID